MPDQPSPLRDLRQRLTGAAPRNKQAVLLALSEGFTATVLVLAERAGIRVDWAQPGAAPDGAVEDAQISAVTRMPALAEGRAWEAGLREKARELGQHMPR